MLSACSDGGSPRAADSEATESVPQTHVTAQALDSRLLDCRDPISEMNKPPDGFEVIGDAIALVTSATSETALQTSETGDADPSQRLFAKNGLLLRTRTQSELIVPSGWRDRLSFHWGNAGSQESTEHLVAGPCDGEASWIAFPGGYLVADPACVDFIVRTTDGDHRVTVGVGAPCDGQRPPPEPTDT
jgi:hypothetical protein